MATNKIKIAALTILVSNGVYNASAFASEEAGSENVVERIEIVGPKPEDVMKNEVFSDFADMSWLNSMSSMVNALDTLRRIADNINKD